MAHIRKLTDKTRSLPWRAQVRRKGHKVLVKMFATRNEAEHWAAEQERTIRLTGLPHTIEELKKHTLGDIVRRYRDEVTPTKGCRVSETSVLNKFLRHKMCAKALAFVSPQDAHEYIHERLKEVQKNGKPITPRTVKRTINSIQPIFKVAKEQWGLTNLQNPFAGIRIRGSMHRRKRRLKDGELERLEQACRDCRDLNRYYVPLAIYLAVETAMRLQEIFNLTWQDIDINKRRIEIRKSKTDHLTAYEGRTIVLSLGAELFLQRLRSSLKSNARFKISNRIFPMTKDAFKQSWSDVKKRAGISDLTFHDLRHEAASRFDEEVELTPSQIKLMMGHASKDITGAYIHSSLKVIQEKLDRYTLYGMTFDEALATYGAIVQNAGITKKPKPVMLEEAVEKSMIKFNSEEEMKEYVDDLEKKYSHPGASVVPFPPEI